MVFFNFDFIPSGSLLFKCKCGITLSNINKKIIPNKNPILAGIHASIFCSCAISIDGINNDQIDAAIITPDANPNNSFSILLSGIRNHLFRYLNHLMLNQYEAVQRILQGANNLLKEEF